MFAPHCPRCDRRVLLGHDRIVTMRTREGRHDVTLQCRCGDRVRWAGGATVAR